MAPQTYPSPSSASTWRLQDAKAQFSALVDNALRGVPQHVTRRGKQAVVLLSEQDFEALQRSAAGNRSGKAASLVEHLLAMPKEACDTTTPADATSNPVLDVQPRRIDFS
jgi:antitoxin Phd